MRLREILQALAEGRMTVEEAEREVRLTALAEVGSKGLLDLGRELRAGVPEVILGEGKRPDVFKSLFLRTLRECGRALASRVDPEQAEAVLSSIPEGYEAEYREDARMLVARRRGARPKPTGGRVGIITAGTSDIPVAEEAKAVAEEMGCEVYTAYDVGVAGVHRSIQAVREMVSRDVDALVVVAGREGALPSVVAGLVDVPVIAVPTSTGYGVGAGGVGALMAMLQTCSLGVAVVNVDAGIQAGAVAALIANRVAKFRGSKRR